MASSGDLYAKGVGQIVDQLRVEFLDEVDEQLKQLIMMIDDVRHNGLAIEELARAMQRACVSIKSQANGYHLTALYTVAMRAEDYLANVRSFLPRALDDIQVFVDVMGDVAAQTVGDDEDLSKLVRKLPAKLPAMDGTLEIRDIEVLLVMHHGAATHFVEREMQECGYRISTCTSTLEAMGVVVRTKPDLVIISAVMPELSGIDLATALAEMPATRNIPTALITSLDSDDPYLKLLSDRVPVIHKSERFGDDLAEALSRLFII